MSELLLMNNSSLRTSFSLNYAARLLRANENAMLFWVRSSTSYKQHTPKPVRFKKNEMNLNQVNVSEEDDLLLKKISIKYVKDFETLKEFVSTLHLYVPFNNHNNNNSNSKLKILILDDFDELTTNQNMVETFKLLCIAKEALGLKNESPSMIASLSDVRLLVCCNLDRADYFENKACFSLIFNNSISTKIESKKFQSSANNNNHTFAYSSNNYNCVLSFEEQNGFVEVI